MGFISNPDGALFAHVGINLNCPSSTGQGTWSVGLANDVHRVLSTSAATAADGDNISFKQTLKAGTYTLVTIIRKDADCGILNLKVNGTTITNYDGYAAAPAYQLLSDDFTLAQDGDVTFTIAINSKNAASSDFVATIYEFGFGRKS